MTSHSRQDKELRTYYKRMEERSGGALPRVTVRAQRHSDHPWVFRRMLDGPYEDLAPGALVEAYTRDERFVGRGIYNKNSEIALRLLTSDLGENIDEGFFKRRIAEAVQLRHEVLRLPDETDAYRVIHSEGDRLSGLVVDRFANALVLELFSAGMFAQLDWITAALKEQFPSASVVVRADHRSEKLEGVKMDGPPPPEELRTQVVLEGRARFQVDLRRGHKTGFFVDQRENRRRIAELCQGMDLFDGFCYTGGFSIAAGLAGAKQVEAVDLDENVIACAEQNRELNGLPSEQVHFRHGNVFDVLREHRTANRLFSRMVLDPAKLAITRDDVPKALDAYADMNRLGMQCLADGGVLLSCSCTGLVGEEDFLASLRAAASEARKELQIFRVCGATPDHPWAVRTPEGRYLKAVYSRVKPL